MTVENLNVMPNYPYIFNKEMSTVFLILRARFLFKWFHYFNIPSNLFCVYCLLNINHMYISAVDWIQQQIPNIIFLWLTYFTNPNKSSFFIIKMYKLYIYFLSYRSNWVKNSQKFEICCCLWWTAYYLNIFSFI